MPKPTSAKQAGSDPKRLAPFPAWYSDVSPETVTRTAGNKRRALLSETQTCLLAEIIAELQSKPRPAFLGVFQMHQDGESALNRHERRKQAAVKRKKIKVQRREENVYQQAMRAKERTERFEQMVRELGPESRIRWRET